MSIVSAGEMFPDLSFTTYSGEELTIGEAVKRKKHTVIWVMRFIGCRFCQYDMDMLAQEYARFTGKDVQVLAVLQSSRDSVRGLKGDYQVPFDIVCDTEHVFYKELDVRATRTKEERMPSDPAGLARLEAKKAAVAARNYERKTGEGEAQQLPALFIMAPDRRIEYAHYAVNSIDIPDFDEMLELIDHLG